jgi:leucyl aminopeptidase
MTPRMNRPRSMRAGWNLAPGLSLALALAACSVAPSPVQTSRTAADSAQREPAADANSTAPAAGQTGDAAVAPRAAPRTFLVSSRATFEGIRSQARLLSRHRDRAGTELVVSEADSDALPQVAAYVHRHEKRCGGFFAFETQAEAEAFAKADRSEQAVATAIAYTLDQPAVVERWLPRVEEPRLRATIAHLSSYQNRFYASPTGRQSAEWIRDTWQSLAAGRADVSTELHTACTTCSTQPSVVLTVRGSHWPDEVVVLGAHLDSINGADRYNPSQLAPGADDDASGIAVLTETLRIALADGWRPKRTVKFMGYAAEEVGLRGSNSIAQGFRAAGVQVIAALQVDMTNYKSGNTTDMKLISDYSNPDLQAFFRQLFDAYLAPRGYTRGSVACGYACSDHASWTAAGYPAAFMFEGGDPAGSFPYIHTTSDTLATMGDSAQHSVKFAQFALAFLAETAKVRTMVTGGPSPAQPQG